MRDKPHDALIEQVLEEGERIVWQDVPNYRKSLPPLHIGKAITIIAVSLPLLLGLVLGLVISSQAPTIPFLVIFPFLTVVFYLILAIRVLPRLLLRGRITSRALKRTRYAVTDRRALLATLQNKGGIDVHEARFNEIAALQCAPKRSDGAGNLIIVLSGAKVSALGSRYQQITFLGVSAVTEIQHLLLQRSGNTKSF